MSNKLSPSRSGYRHTVNGNVNDNANVEAVDYLEDYINDGETETQSQADSGGSWPDDSTITFENMESVPLTPEEGAAEFRADTYAMARAAEQEQEQQDELDEMTPLKGSEGGGGMLGFKLGGNRKTDKPALTTLPTRVVPSSEPSKRSNFLASFKSPPEYNKKKPMYNEGYSVDNRTRTPLFPLYHSNSSSSLDPQHTTATFLPSHYLTASEESPALHDRRRQVPDSPLANVPAIMGSYSQDTASSGLTPANQRTPDTPEDRSAASFHSNQSRVSVNSRRRSNMSYRSSTSMSLLFGEVITLDNPRFQSPQPSATGSVASKLTYSDMEHPQNTQRYAEEHDDIEHQGIIEGMEIGGVTRPAPPASTPRQRSQTLPRIALDNCNDYFVTAKQKAGYVTHVTKNEVKKLTDKTKSKLENFLHHYRPPPSPRSRELKDLKYLQRSHKQKLGQLTDNVELEDEHYDFVLILTPQEVYRYWADLLDFQVEHLGVDSRTGMDTILEANSTTSTDDTCSDGGQEPPIKEYSTPVTGMKRRPGKGSIEKTVPHTAPVSRSRPSNVNSMFSPGLLSVGGTGMKRSRLSMFEKAIGGAGSPVSGRKTMDGSFPGAETPTPNKDPRPSVSSVRRRWGNHAVMNKANAAHNMLSPPVRSLTRGATSIRKLPVNYATPAKSATTTDDQENKDPNSLEIPTQVIPRGIAARTNGMLQFLSALNRGIVVRRHRSNKEAVYCKIFSRDGGDTIKYQFIDPEEAMVAFKEQRVRYNRNLTHGASKNTVRNISREWSFRDCSEDGSPVHKFKLPDFVAAQRYREKLLREHGFTKRLSDLATKAANSGFVRAVDIVAVHPTAHLDPRFPGSRKGELGTATLRRSKSDHYIPHTFSLVSTVGQRFNSSKPRSLDSDENKWYSGEGNELSFKILDFEAATEGEYWLIFRGFLLLHRDAAVGRFAAERRAGIGGGNRARVGDLDDTETEEDELENRLHRDEFEEPVTVGAIEKLIVKLRKLDDTYMKGSVLPDSASPPSDYFLGFRSPGTQIWSRLRLAGLETSRMYAVDTNRVMIKVRCPEDRLTDVAEVLRLKMRTVDGGFAAFREDTAEIYAPHSDTLDIPSCYYGQAAALLRSKDRQTIINFIIGSRIRDSGAELGLTTDVGKMIQARVPLHMHKKLDALYQSWVKYWQRENWVGRDGKALAVRPEFAQDLGQTSSTFADEDGAGEDKELPVPGRLARFFVGAFYQPLDSVEEYFGEEVTFYFAWLQHVARHLVFLAVCGLIVTVIQMSSNSFDHPIRPFFAMVVMLWTFVVLVNWRKRSNFLAYRWGTMDYKVQETTRPEFHGKYVVDDITQEWVVRYPKWKRWVKYLISFPVSIFFTVLALLLILLVHTNRDLQMASYIEKQTNPDAEPFKFKISFTNIGEKAEISEVPLTKDILTDPMFWVVMGTLPAMLGLCIPIMNLILMRISVMLNNFENYRTESEYRTHLIIKVFSFRFVSQFGTVYYYAYLSMGDKLAIENGILRMGTSLLVYTTVAHWWQIFLQVYFFMFLRNFRRWRYRSKLRDQLKSIEIEEEAIADGTGDTAVEIERRQICLINKRMLLDQAQDDIWFEIMNPPHNSFPEYITAVIQFTFVTCFSVVLPITPIFVLFNYLLSMRYDAYKLCRGRRRPLARKTGGIGIWEHLVHIVAVIAVLTNCWLMGFTNSDFGWLKERVGSLGIFAIVVAWEHIMLLIKYVMQVTISPLPRSVQEILKREQHLLERKRQTTLRTKKGRRSQFQKSRKQLRLSSDSTLSLPHDGFEDESSIRAAEEPSWTPKNRESSGLLGPIRSPSETSSGLYEA